MLVLGISAFYHDSAAALIKDGVILVGRPGGALYPEKTRLPHFRCMR